MTMSSGLSQIELRDAFVDDLSAVWKWFREAYAAHTPYAFALYGRESAQQLIPQVLTEQALASVAQDYVDKGHYDDMEIARRALCYSVADSPLFKSFVGKLPAVDRLLSSHGNALGETQRSVVLVNAAVAALEKMDEMGAFGSRKQREGIVLMIALDGIDEEWIEARVKQLNPTKVYSRYVEATTPDGPFASCNVLVVSPDGKSVCAAGARANPRAKAGSSDEFVSQIIAFECDGRRAKRRWKYEFPHSGDSVRAMRWDHSDQTLVVLRARYRKRRRAAILMRFGRDSKRPLSRKEITGEPASFAVSCDGSCVAVTMHDQELVLLDRDFNTIRRAALAFRPGDVIFLPSGELLVGGDEQILRITRHTGAIIGTIAFPGRNMSIDDAAQFLAASRWFAITGAERMRPFGLSVLSLPSLQVHQAYHIPGHQLVRPTLSPDGKLLALQAHEAKGYRRLVVVFDNLSGRKIAERRCDSGAPMEFLPDGRSLAIGRSGHLAGNPIELWTVPFVV